MRKLAPVLTAVLIAVVMLGAAVNELVKWSVKRSSRPGAPEESAKRLLTVAFSGEDLGHLEPCGCTPAMLGGLARRPARLRASQEPGVPFVYVSGGALVDGTSEYDHLRLDIVLRALASMKCVAFSPSGRELGLGRMTFAKMDDDVRVAGVEFVGANVERSTIPPRFFANDDVVRLLADPTVAYVTGVCAPRAATEDVIVTDPAAALRRVRQGMPPGAALVVLSDLDQAAARALAASDAGPTVVLYAGGRTDPFDDDVTQGRCAVAPLPAKGKFVGLAHLVETEDGPAWEVEYRPVLPDLPEDPGVVDLKVSHLNSLRERDVVHANSGNARFVVGPAPAEDARYAGSDACADCHAEDTRVWAASRHATAIETLRKTGDDADPDCVRCHVVGYGTGRGFAATDAAASLGSVGCESCHGPRARHVEERRAGRADARVPAATERSCLPCHDGEHDPQFDYAPYWARIAHGTR